MENRKLEVWTVHLEEMSSSWAAGRVPPPASLPSATTETFAREGMHSSSEAERVRSPVSPPQSPNREEPSVVIFRLVGQRLNVFKDIFFLKENVSIYRAIEWNEYF